MKLVAKLCVNVVCLSLYIHVYRVSFFALFGFGFAAIKAGKKYPLCSLKILFFSNLGTFLCLTIQSNFIRNIFIIKKKIEVYLM